MRAGAAIFRQAVIAPLKGCTVAVLSQSSNVVRQLAQLHLKYDRDMLDVVNALCGATRQTVLSNPLYVSLQPSSGVEGTDQSSTELIWSVEDGKGIYIARGQCASVYAGHAERFEEATGGQIAIAGPALVSVTVTALDQTQLDQSRKILVTACGRCENTGMIFSRDRRTVGTNWGRSPVRIQAVKGTLALPAGQWICHALGPDGLLGSQVPVLYEAGKSILQMEPKYITMWYLLTRRTE